MTDPEISAKLTALEKLCGEATQKRFWGKVEKVPFTTCWLWTGSTDGRYGQFWVGPDRRGSRIKAHRASWMMTHGFLSDDIYVLHKCDTPPCVRPDHLFLGGSKENMLDASAKGRLIRTECKRGHSLRDGEGIWFWKDMVHPQTGEAYRTKFCRLCRRIRESSPSGYRPDRLMLEKALEGYEIEPCEAHR